MFTTIGLWAFAMSRNVVAVSWPVIGSLFIAGNADELTDLGAAEVCASELGTRSSLAVITAPTATDVTAIRAPENSVCLPVAIVSLHTCTLS